MEPTDTNPTKEYKPNPFAIMSLFFASVPIVIWIIIKIAFAGIKGDALLLLLIMGMVALAINIVADIIAVIFGVLAIKRQNAFFSWLGIIIVLGELAVFLVI
jgi:hypothetical protein